MQQSRLPLRCLTKQSWRNICQTDKKQFYHHVRSKQRMHNNKKDTQPSQCFTSGIHQNIYNAAGYTSYTSMENIHLPDHHHAPPLVQRHVMVPFFPSRSPDEKAQKFQRPIAQTTIDEEEVSKFSAWAAAWWDEGGEFAALHSLNELRVPLVRDALVAKKPLDRYSQTKPLDGFWIMDIGSGGGILSEPLARLGASVIGVDASEENIKIAQAHLIHDPSIRDRVKYVNTTVEEIAQTQAGKFDAVVASEVLEHVADADTFVSSACQLVRPGGSIFFTTLNKTVVARVLGVFVAENVLHLVSPGTHDWEKFVPPKDLSFMLDQNKFTTRLIHGMCYNPLTKRWSWTQDTSINYAIHAVKASDSPESDVWAPLEESPS